MFSFDMPDFTQCSSHCSDDSDTATMLLPGKITWLFAFNVVLTSIRCLVEGRSRNDSPN